MRFLHRALLKRTNSGYCVHHVCRNSRSYVQCSSHKSSVFVCGRSLRECMLSWNYSASLNSVFAFGYSSQSSENVHRIAGTGTDLSGNATPKMGKVELLVLKAILPEAFRVIWREETSSGQESLCRWVSGS